MEQLIFELAIPEPPSFANFLSGPNREVVAALERFAGGSVAETGLVLWGPPGVGKTHLLRAAAAAAQGSRPVHFFPDPNALPDALPSPAGLVLVDDADAASESMQGRLFTLYNALRATGGSLVAAAKLPPARLPLRDDIRSRLGWGLKTSRSRSPPMPVPVGSNSATT
jgi:DnaA-homolog protein